MNTRTYEILAKWIANTHGVSIEWDNVNPVPRADIKNKRIVLPTGVDEKNTYAALTQLMHEAAHINYTQQIPCEGKDRIAEDQLSHDILNVIEDVRIDGYNFRVLPNIHEFYRRGLQYEIEKRKNIDMSQVPLHKKVLINVICDLERLPEGRIKDRQAEELQARSGINQIVSEGVRQIERQDWKGLKETVSKVMKILGLDKMPKMPITSWGHVGGEGKNGQNKGNASGSAAGSGSNGKDPSGGGSSGKDSKKDCQGCGGSGKDPHDPSGEQPCPKCGGSGSGEASARLDDLGKDDGVFTSGRGQGHHSAAGTAVLGAVAMQELTKAKFKELLDVKQTVKIEEPQKINVDNLAAFFTGDIDDLFFDQQTQRKKKSKILFVMDSSGSMSAQLLDGKSRKFTVSGCVDQLCKILDSVRAIEGIDVDYDVAAFDDRYHPMSKDNWKKEYGTHGGGTDLIGAFKQGMEQISKDSTVDGNRMIVFFSDGEVSEHEIHEMDKMIKQSGADIRVMIIGVGAEITSAFVTNIVGDANIIANESSDLVLMETIMTMLD